jgi:hypothetical protein
LGFTTQQPGKKQNRVSIPVSAVRRSNRADQGAFASRLQRTKPGSQAMNTVLITTQILCYSVGIVSASLNIASFVRVRRVRRQRRARMAELA